MCSKLAIKIPTLFWCRCYLLTYFVPFSSIPVVVVAVVVLKFTDDMFECI